MLLKTEGVQCGQPTARNMPGLEGGTNIKEQDGAFPPVFILMITVFVFIHDLSRKRLKAHALSMLIFADIMNALHI